MDIYLMNTASGLIPCTDEDYEKKRKLKIGRVYKTKMTLARNYEFHKKYFALINCAWEYQNERTVEFFHHNPDAFRKTVEISAGHYELVYSIARREWVEQAKSIAFDKMDEAEFQDLYERVKDVLFSTFLRHVKEEEFMSNLANF